MYLHVSFEPAGLHKNAAYQSIKERIKQNKKLKRYQNESRNFQ